MMVAYHWLIYLNLLQDITSLGQKPSSFPSHSPTGLFQATFMVDSQGCKELFQLLDG